MKLLRIKFFQQQLEIFNSLHQIVLNNYTSQLFKLKKLKVIKINNIFYLIQIKVFKYDRCNSFS